jgi:hypothetical protein
MITLSDYFKGRDKKFSSELSEEKMKNAFTIIAKASELLSAFGEKRLVRSGWRPENLNKQMGGSPTSQHIWCNAIDLEDNDGRLKKWCLDNEMRLNEVEIWMEHPDYTPTWVHWQRVPPKSGNRFFKP